jgi:hypothetical protein
LIYGVGSQVFCALMNVVQLTLAIALGSLRQVRKADRVIVKASA